MRTWVDKATGERRVVGLPPGWVMRPGPPNEDGSPTVTFGPREGGDARAAAKRKQARRSKKRSR